MYGTDTYHAFYDSKAEVFAVVADNEYSPYISYPILAYGKGNRMWSGEYTSDQHVISSILNSYDVQLKYMKRKQLFFSTNFFLSDIIHQLRFSGRSETLARRY